MEIFIGNNLPAAINSIKERQRSTSESAKSRHTEAINQIKGITFNTFQSDLNSVLNPDTQKNLNLEIIGGEVLATTYAKFNYGAVDFQIKRIWSGDDLVWQLVKDDAPIFGCDGFFFENMLLMELSKISN